MIQGVDISLSNFLIQIASELKAADIIYVHIAVFVPYRNKKDDLWRVWETLKAHRTFPNEPQREQITTHLHLIRHHHREKEKAASSPSSFSPAVNKHINYGRGWGSNENPSETLQAKTCTKHCVASHASSSFRRVERERLKPISNSVCRLLLNSPYITPHLHI